MSESSEQTPVRVLVVDDQHLMRDGLASLLSIQEGIEVVGTAANGEEAVDQTLNLAPDVVLMDIRMPVRDGIAAAEQIRRRAPKCQVLMLTTFDDDDLIVKALLAGACGYLLKDVPSSDLAQAIRLAHRGVYQLGPSVAGKLVGALAGSVGGHSPHRPVKLATPSRANTAGLTEREIEVLRLVARGYTNREIAEELVLSEGTVKNHVSNILNCLGLRDRTQAAIYARENDLF